MKFAKRLTLLLESGISVDRDGDLYYVECPRCHKMGELKKVNKVVIPKAAEFNKRGYLDGSRNIRQAIQCKACGELFGVYGEDGMKEFYRDFSNGKDAHNHANYAIGSGDEVLTDHQYTKRALEVMGLAVGQDAQINDPDSANNGEIAKIIEITRDGRVRIDLGDDFTPTYDHIDLRKPGIMKEDNCHHLRKICKICGNVRTCRCSAPKVVVYDICYDCRQ